MSKGKGLGRGLDSLLPSDFDAGLLLDSNDRVQKLFIIDITPNAEQPRRHFDEQALHELAASIKQYGVLQPIIVSPAADKTYRIAAGERRWRAAQLAGLKQIPAIVRQPQEMEELEIALIENVQRVDLSPIEQAISIERLHQQFNTPYVDIAKRMGKASTTLNNIVRLLQLPEDARQALEKGQISEGHARAILALKDDKALQKTLLQTILREGWSVRQAERFVTANREGHKEPRAIKARVATETPETKQLSKNLGHKVSLRRTARGGRLEIQFKTEEELKVLVKRLGNN